MCTLDSEFIFEELVGRSKDIALIQRNQQILDDIRQGIPYQVIADKWGLSKQRIAQINQESQETVTDDAYRELQRTRLEYIQDELFRDFKEPAQLVNARGPVYEMIRVNTADGMKTVPDLDRPVYDRRLKIEIAGAITKIDERLAKLFGLERGKQRERDQSSEQIEFLNYLQQIADENEELKKRVAILSRDVIEGEAIPSSGEEQTGTI